MDSGVMIPNYLYCEILMKLACFTASDSSSSDLAYKLYPFQHAVSETAPSPGKDPLMPTVTINAEGVVLYYEDSGPPAGSSNYVTLVVIHGFIFHGGKLHVN